MKKNIQIITLICSLFLFGACDNWLDVKPYDKIAEEDLFKNQDGFRRLLNGVYIELNDNNMYGRALTVEMLELMGGAYSIGNDVAKWENYVDLAAYEYTSQYWKSRFDQVWEKSYSLIMNSNKIIDNMERRKSIFTGDNYNIIRGEALALRAMLHFDMLRLFGPVYKDNPEAISIPYYASQKTSANDLLPANEVMGLVLKDLKEAEELLLNDPVVTEGTMMSPSDGSGDNFLRYRALRLNYYAVQGLMARAYLYAGDKPNASLYAKKVIKASEDGIFPFTNRTNSRTDRIFSSEVMFALSNSNRVLMFKNFHDPARNPSYIFTMDGKLLSYIFGERGSSTVSDMRYEGNWEQVTMPGLSGGSRYFYHYNDMADAGRIENTMVPMLRIGEMYLIAAESESDNLDDGLKHINTLRNKRGIADLGALTMANLNHEYMRELYGEGQLFYFYKRTFMTILNRTNNSGSIAQGQAPSNKVFIVPLPDTEINNR